MRVKKKTIVLIIIGAVVVLTSTGIYLLARRAKKLDFEFITAQKETLIQEVSVTGKVRPAQSVSLSFEKAGRVAAVYVEVSDKVKAQQSLVALDNSELQSELAKYQAALEVEQAKLAELKKGARPEELEVTQIKVTNAQTALADAKENLVNVQNKADVDLANAYDDVGDTLQDALAEADNALNTQIDDLFTNDSSENPQLTFSTTNSSKEVATEVGRVQAGEALIKLTDEVNNLSVAYDKMDISLEAAEDNLITIRDFLSQLAEALNITAGLTQTTINTYKGYVNTAKDNINTAITSINTQKQAIASQKATNQKDITTAQTAVNNAQSTLELRQKELALQKAGATIEQLKAQEAQVKAAEANVNNTVTQIAKTVLRSPINGIVTQQDAKKGEIVSASSILVSLISEAQFEIEAFIPEVDIAKLKLADQAKITLDAYGENIGFEAVVTAINPAETVIEGVATYKVTLQFLTQDERIKPGMTANLDILTAQKENVIAVPYRSLIEKDSQKYVRILIGKQTIKERMVITGLRGSDGNIEIVQGLNPGDKVIIFLEEK